MRERFMRFMAGRYGIDALGRALSLLALILMIPALFWRRLLYVSLLLLALMYFRMFSRRPDRRMRENQLYLQLSAPLRRRMGGFFARLGQRKTHRFYRCPACGQRIRVPRGKGRIRVTCPRCRNQFIEKS